MDGYEFESSPFFVNQDNSVSLYRGRTREGNLPVVIKRHDFNNIQDKAVQISMVRTFNAALAQAKVPHPHTCDILEVQMEIERDSCSIFHILETSVEDLGADLENCSRTSGTSAELGMDGYELESLVWRNTDFNTILYRECTRRGNLPVVIKCHDFYNIQDKEVQISMVRTLNAALVLAKMQHPNVCDIQEVQMEIQETNCRIFHVLEALDSDLERDIEGRRSSNRPYAEGELRLVLLQTASVLACAHSKRIAHRDVRSFPS